MPEPRPNPVPTGRTAQRLTWPFLPPHVRALVEERCGSAVVDAASQGGGFTPGFASVLTCADGIEALREGGVGEGAAALRRLLPRGGPQARRRCPSGVPAPRLLWSSDDDWVVLGIEHVEGRLPRRPWSRCRPRPRAQRRSRRPRGLLTPAPSDLGLDTFATEFAAFGGMWARLRDDGSATSPHLDEAEALAVALRRRDRGRHARPHRRPRRQPDPGPRRTHLDLRLELARHRRRLARHALPAHRAARRRSRRRCAAGLPAPDPRRARRVDRRRAGPGHGLLPAPGARSRRRPPRRTCGPTSSGRARSAGTG